MIRISSRDVYKLQTAWRVLVIATLIGLAIYFAYFFDLKARLLLLFAWMDALRFWGPALLILGQAMLSLLVIPGPIFTLASGFLFGALLGAVFSITGMMLGAMAAFGIARVFFGGGMARWLLEHPKLRLLNVGLAEYGWKFIMSTRLFPFFPYKLSNYFFGLTRVSFRQFVIGNLLGIIPYQILGTYTGSIISSLADLRDPTLLRNPVNLVIYTLGFCFCVTMVLLANRKAKENLGQVLGPQAAKAMSKAASGGKLP